MERFVHLLGPPRVRVGDEVHEPSPTLASAVAFYLAAEDGWVSRDEVCAVFWGDKPQALARTSLRQVLHVLRGEPYAEGIDAERTRLAWSVATDLDASTNHEPATFLEGFQLPQTPAFEDWVERRRARVLQDRRSRAHAAAQDAIDHKRAGNAIDVLTPWLMFDDLDERSLQLYLTAAADAGLAAEGVRRYQRFQGALEEELGMAPSEHTESLAQDLARRWAAKDTVQAPDTEQVSKSEHAPEAEPAPATKPPEPQQQPTTKDPGRWPLELIGRTAERDRIERWAAEPGCIGIYGPGGIGKTRLAWECFRRLRQRFSGDAWWIPLGGAGEADEALAQVAQALGQGVTGGAEPIDLLAAYLGGRDTLLVLDNLEQIEDASEMIQTLEVRCPELRLLFTSRVRWDLPQAKAIELRGLPVDDGDAPAARASTAADMFIAAAQRHGRDVDLEHDLLQLEAFCRTVQGMPLALEHAAAWTRVLPVQHALDRWKRDPAEAPPYPTDTDPRHATVGRVFETSWRLLGAADRDALRRLQVFREGCTLEAARDVAGVGIAMIVRLKDHAMIDLDRAGRVAQHPLLTEWLEGKVEADDDLREQHARYFMTLLAEAEYEFQNVDSRAAIRRISPDLANIDAAWTWTLDDGAWELFDGTGPVLGFALLERLRMDHWVTQLEEASARIPQDHPAWARVESHAASMAGIAGDRQGALARGRRARAQARHHDDPELLGWTCLLLSNTVSSLDRGEEAGEARREAYEQFRRTGQGGLIGMALGGLYVQEPDRSERERWYAELKPLLDRLQNPTLNAEVAIPRVYGLVHDWGRYAEALELARSAVEAHRETEWSLMDFAVSLTAEAHVLNYVGNLEAAERSAQEALDCTADLGRLHYFDARYAAVEISRARRMRGDIDGARRALTIVRPGRETPTENIHYEQSLLALDHGDAALAQAHADAAAATLPKRPWQRGSFWNSISVQLLHATVAAHAGAPDAAPRLRGALDRAWSMRFIPLTLHALAQLLPWLADHERSRVASLLAGSTATSFETRLLLARQGLAKAEPAPIATEGASKAAQAALEAELAEKVARFARA